MSAVWNSSYDIVSDAGILVQKNLLVIVDIKNDLFNHVADEKIHKSEYHTAHGVHNVQLPRDRFLFWLLSVLRMNDKCNREQAFCLQNDKHAAK